MVCKQFNDKTVNFMDNLFNKAYRDLKKTNSKENCSSKFFKTRF